MSRINVTPTVGKTSTSTSVTTGSIALSSSASVVVTLPASMGDTSYVVSAEVEDSNGDLAVRCITARTATTVTVKVVNNNAVSARTGTLHVRAEHL